MLEKKSFCYHNLSTALPHLLSSFFSSSLVFRHIVGWTFPVYRMMMMSKMKVFRFFIALRVFDNDMMINRRPIRS